MYLCKQNLFCGKNVLIDMSINSAYVMAICGAQHFIYIENQYFIVVTLNDGWTDEVNFNSIVGSNQTRFFLQTHFSYTPKQILYYFYLEY